MTFGVILLSALSPLMLVAHYAVPVSCGWLITAGFMAVSRPSGPFDPDSAPAPLDYTQASAWHALPEASTRCGWSAALLGSVVTRALRRTRAAPPLRLRRRRRRAARAAAFARGGLPSP